MTQAGYRQCQKCGKNRAERFFSGPRGRTCSSCRKAGRSRARHELRVQSTYGLEPGEYAKLLAAQDGKCAICRGVRRYRLSVDHDHKTNLVRGLLCRMCNERLLTAARDRPEVLRSAADYLDAPPAQTHIGLRYYQDQKEHE
ncbi:endonuclease VII domain-containing protein [Kitasatospora aureofaciens]|uniref:endonuclease VII domain-containing protein n=1 Tax=Kitasatospora aureofaciens TaxID=1894 RepID=UPI0033F20E62